MATQKRRFTISLSEELIRDIEQFQHRYEIPRRSDALQELAEIGLNAVHKRQEDCGIPDYEKLDKYGKRTVEGVIREELRRIEDSAN